MQVKNTRLHLNGQNLRLAAKNSRSSKTPGHHVSLAYEKEVAGGFTAPPLTLRSLRRPLGSTFPDQQARRPHTLAPLELPEDVREAQRQKLKQQAKPPNNTRKVTSPMGLTRAVVCPTEPHRATSRSSKPQLTSCTPMELKGDGQLEEVVCCGTPAPLYTKLGPLTPQIRAHASYGTEEAAQNPSSLLQDTSRRRLRLRRTQCLEEDQQVSDKSTAGLSVEKGNLAQGVQGRGERAARGQRPPGKGISQPPAASLEKRSIRKSHQEDYSQNQQAAESGRREQVLDGIKCFQLEIRQQKRLGHKSLLPCPP